MQYFYPIHCSSYFVTFTRKLKMACKSVCKSQNVCPISRPAAGLFFFVCCSMKQGPCNAIYHTLLHKNALFSTPLICPLLYCSVVYSTVACKQGDMPNTSHALHCTALHCLHCTQLHCMSYTALPLIHCTKL